MTSCSKVDHSAWVFLFNRCYGTGVTDRIPPAGCGRRRPGTWCSLPSSAVVGWVWCPCSSWRRQTARGSLPGSPVPARERGHSMTALGYTIVWPGCLLYRYMYMYITHSTVEIPHPRLYTWSVSHMHMYTIRCLNCIYTISHTYTIPPVEQEHPGPGITIDHVHQYS